MVALIIYTKIQVKTSKINHHKISEKRKKSLLPRKETQLNLTVTPSLTKQLLMTIMKKESMGSNLPPRDKISSVKKEVLRGEVLAPSKHLVRTQIFEIQMKI